MRNEFLLCEDIVFVFLKRKDGSTGICLVDAGDLALLRQLQTTWSCAGRYVRSGRYGMMHNVLMGNRPSVLHCVDHINGDGLDNRRSRNLRWLTHSENCKNIPENTRTRLRWRPEINRVFSSAVYPPMSIHISSASAATKQIQPLSGGSSEYAI
jgi:hypothetical protein